MPSLEASRFYSKSPLRYTLIGAGKEERKKKSGKRFPMRIALATRGRGKKKRGRREGSISAPRRAPQKPRH